MQTLTPTLFPCYAPGDRKLARRVADFLERGADVRVFFEEGELQPGEDLAAKAREARTADIVVVLFSRESLPSRWRRDQWEPALVTEPAEEGVRMAFLRSDECNPPKVLAPMFEANLNGLRQLKRWVRGKDLKSRTGDPHSPELEVMGIAIADRPGLETVEESAVARDFARVFRDDFDEVLLLECAGRTQTALAGDLGVQLGLRLEGPLAENMRRLHEFCSQRRMLVVLDGASAADADAFTSGGRCSTLISTGEYEPSNVGPIRAAQMALTRAEEPWPELCRHARTGRRLLHTELRLAELLELMQQWHQLAESRHDRGVMDEAAREMMWILQEWGEVERAREFGPEIDPLHSDQMMLPFL